MLKGLMEPVTGSDWDRLEADGSPAEPLTTRLLLSLQTPEQLHSVSESQSGPGGEAPRFGNVCFDPLMSSMLSIWIPSLVTELIAVMSPLIGPLADLIGPSVH